MDKLKLHNPSREIIQRSILENEFEHTETKTLRQRHQYQRRFVNEHYTITLNGFGTFLTTNPTKVMKGNNVEQVTLPELRDFVQILENGLRIRNQDFTVTGFDFNGDVETSASPEVYLPLLRNLPKFNNKTQYLTGVTFRNGCKTFSFYDKIEQLKQTKEPVPLEYQNRNLLRIEMGIDRKLRQTKGFQHIETMTDLTDKDTYSNIVTEWKSNYDKVNKQGDGLRFDTLTKPNEFKLDEFLLLHFLNSLTLEGYFDLIEQERLRGKFTYKQSKTRRDKATRVWNRYVELRGGTNLLDELNTKVETKTNELLSGLS